MPADADAATGLTPNEKGPDFLYVGPGRNLSWPNEDINITYAIPHGMSFWPWCDYWKDPQHAIFHFAYSLFAIAYAGSSSIKGMLYLHSILIAAFMILCGWAWSVICAPDVFTWNFAFMLLNIGQVVYIVYQMRPVKFDPELEEVYHNLFFPFKMSRLQFKRMVSTDFAQIMSLHAGEAYAMQNLTRTDRLGLLLSGKVNVLSDHQFLHPILPCEFLDSPEFESSRASVDDKFKVSIVAASTCRYVYWQRAALEYLFVKETYAATVLTTLIARDIATKLYAMNNKIVTGAGSHLDIRLPSITSSLTASSSAGAMDPEYKSPAKAVRRLQARNIAGANIASEVRYTGVGTTITREQRFNRDRLHPEMQPLTELPSSDDIASTGVESWLESSSKYHSCELADEEDDDEEEEEENSDSDSDSQTKHPWGKVVKTR